MTMHREDFPADFIFGAATSAYQIEGQKSGGAGPTHWDTFARRHGAIADGTDGATTCDHYHRFADDIALMRGLDAYRFSINWARVLPQGRGAPNPDGLDFYDRLVDSCLANGLRPFITLYHWEMPQALAERGGWADHDTPLWFADFAELVARRIGDRAHAFATLNEPWCSAWLGHFEGIHAPGAKSLPQAARAMHNLLRGHGEALARLRDMGLKNLGIALNFEPTAPARDSDADKQAARRHDALINRWFLEALLTGAYPQEALEGLSPHLPENWQQDMPGIRAPLDWLGVNYYTRAIIADDPAAPWPGIFRQTGPLPKTAMGWEIYPQGLADVVRRIGAASDNALPLYITENGIALEDAPTGGHCTDPARWQFIQSHLQQLAVVMDEGAPVRGFFYWSLLDNFEWAEGHRKRFGLVHVDFESQKRTPKASYYHFTETFGNRSR